MRGIHLRLLMAAVGWGVLGIGLLPGCATSTSTSTEAPATGKPKPSEDLFPQGFLTIHPGQMDAEDRYLSAVMVLVGPRSQGGLSGGCSGVLAHPRMVITAGHCVCARRAPTREDQEGRANGKAASNSPRQAGVITRAAALQDVSITEISDARSSCVENVMVRTFSYALGDGGSSHEKPERFTGRVVLHPDFEIIFGRRGGAAHVVWSNADLAVILLENPVPFGLPRLELADAEAQVGDIITMVGFSYGVSSPPSYGIRHFGDNSVNRLILLETGSTVFRAQEQLLPDGGTASHAQQGDSGGACIKKGARNLLVGITTLGGTRPTGERMSFFTSIYSHRSWLLQMLELADKA